MGGSQPQHTAHVTSRQRIGRAIAALAAAFSVDVSKLETLRSMPAAERRLNVLTPPLLAITTLCLRVLGFGRTGRLVARLAPPPGGDDSPDWSRVGAAERAVARAAHYLPTDARCLAQSITLWWLIRRTDADPELCVGVRRADGRMKGHAWVELDGKVLNDRADVGRFYTRFDHSFMPRDTDQ